LYPPLLLVFFFHFISRVVSFSLFWICPIAASL
jgi:hypothetical protein